MGKTNPSPCVPSLHLTVWARHQSRVWQDVSAHGHAGTLAHTLQWGLVICHCPTASPGLTYK